MEKVGKIKGRITGTEPLSQAEKQQIEKELTGTRVGEFAISEVGIEAGSSTAVLHDMTQRHHDRGQGHANESGQRQVFSGVAPCDSYFDPTHSNESV